METDFQKYIESWSKELMSRANRVRDLIGDSHWLSDGGHKEEIIRSFLRRYLPPTLSLERGFIRPVAFHNECSPEIDILVTSSVKHPPLFLEGDLQIVFPSSVLASMEVKSSYSQQILLKALANQVAVREVMALNDRSENFWAGIVFGHCDTEIDILMTHISYCISNTKMIHDAMPVRFQGKTQIETRHFPNCIASFDRFVTFIEPTMGREIKIRIFDLGEKSMGVAFLDLLSHIRCQLNGDKAGAEIDKLLDLIEYDSVKVKTVAIG